MKQKINSILLHLPHHLVVEFGKYTKCVLIYLPNLTTRWICKSGKKADFFWLHPPPTSLEAYSLLYLYLYSSVNWTQEGVSNSNTRFALPKLENFNFAGEFWIASKRTNKDSKQFYEAVNVDPRISRIDKNSALFLSKIFRLIREFIR